MQAPELYKNLTERGFTLRAKDDVLLVAPRGALTPEDAEAIQAHKSALLKLLEWERFKQFSSPGSPEHSLALMVDAERIIPEIDKYGIRLTPKMSGDLYIAVANYRRANFERLKRTFAAVED